MGRHHLKAINASGRAVIVGVADPAATEEELRPLLPADAIVTGDAVELIARARPDVVHIVTPPSTHVALAEQAIRKGCHVYVEKPFVDTRAEAEHLLALAEEHGVKVCAGHQVLFEEPALAIWRALPEIGRLVHIESYFSFKMVRRTITPVDQVKDILPHAVYPVVDQLRAGTGDRVSPIEVVGMSLDAAGDAYVLLKLGRATAVVMVTLNGRPVEQYQSIVGSNGSLRADYIGGGLAKLVGPGTGPGVLLTPFRRAYRTVTSTTRGVVRLLVGGTYGGLRTLTRRFYESILDETPMPLTPRSIVDTVSICETIGTALSEVERAAEAEAKRRLETAAAALPPVDIERACVLVTGGTGLLGRRVAEELRQSGFPVRVVARRIPTCSRRVPGVEYAAGDLARGLDPTVLKDVGTIVHSAAETSGGKEDHRRNSIEATRRLLEAAAASGVKQIVHISSLAVLRTSRDVGRALDESVEVDPASIKRGPYVWGKAESELVARAAGIELGLDVKIIRPGPLVDYSDFHPPGRLGRELGPWFVAIGPKSGALSVCDVTTAARVIRSYLENFAAAPPLLNLVEAPAARRRELAARYLKARPDLSVIWVPAFLLQVLAGPLKLVQRLALGSKQPVDVAAAFASERYRTELAAGAIGRASAASVNPRG
jgi:predicted dehydrogenase/nucleoside-diphosphate-sugar epimerase